jgi:hypothetical protein
LTARADVGDAAPRDVVGGAVRGRANGEREPADQGDAALEPHQLHRDLALVVVHGEHGVEIAVPRPQENRVGRERALDGNIQFGGSAHRGLEEVNLLSAEVPALSGMRIERCDGDSRALESGRTHRRTCQREAAQDAVRSDRGRDLRQRDVRRDAGVPETVQDIELAGGPGPL